MAVTKGASGAGVPPAPRHLLCGGLMAATARWSTSAWNDSRSVVGHMSTPCGVHGHAGAGTVLEALATVGPNPRRQLLRLGNAAAIVTDGAFRLGAASVAGPAKGLPSCVRPPRSARSRPEVASVPYHPVDVSDAGWIRAAVGTCSDARPPRAVVDCADSRPSMRIANNHGVHDLDLYLLPSPGESQEHTAPLLLRRWVGEFHVWCSSTDAPQGLPTTSAHGHHSHGIRSGGTAMPTRAVRRRPAVPTRQRSS
jgi:hypothetical protein